MNHIQLTPCESSNVAAWGYQDGTLAVQFKSGATYHYPGVPADVAAQLREPEVSVGRFIGALRGQYNGVLQQPPEENLDE